MKLSDAIVGQRVRLSMEGRKLFPSIAEHTAVGTITSVLSKKGLIRVKRDDRTSVDTYHPIFWEPL